MSEIESKKCSKCEIVKELCEYYQTRTQCKKCHIGYIKNWYATKKCYVVYRYYYNNVLLYIGATTNPYKRELNHKSHFKTGNDSCPDFYKHLRLNGLDFDDLTKEIQEYPGADKKIIHEIENNLIKELQPLCNTLGKQIDVACECGGRYKVRDKCHHIKTKLHKKFLETNENRYQLDRFVDSLIDEI